MQHKTDLLERQAEQVVARKNPEPVPEVEMKQVKQAVGLSGDLVAKFENLAEKLLNERKATKVPLEYPSKKDISNYKTSKVVPMSSNVKCFDVVEDVMILASQDNGALVTVGFDGKPLFEIRNQGNAKYMIDNNEKVFVAGSKSGLIDLKSGNYDYIVDCHDNVTAFTFQPLGYIVACGSDDSSWSLHNIK